MEFETAAAIMNCLGSPVRLKLFHLLAKAGDEGMPVGDIQAAVGIPGPTLSHHLAKLAGVGLLTQERRATTLICRVEPRPLLGLRTYLSEATSGST